MAKLDRIANVSISLNTTAINQQSFSDLLVVGTHMLSVGRVLVVTGADELLDLGLSSSDPLYTAVSDALSQIPSINRIYVGRRQVDEATITIDRAVEGVEYAVTVKSRAGDGSIVETVSTYTAPVDATLETIATALAAAISADSSVVTATAAIGIGSITIEADVPGTAFALASGANMTMSVGQSAESMTDALAAISTENGDWYGVVIASKVEADIMATADWVEANEKLFNVSSAQMTILDQAITTDIGSKLRDKQYFRSAVWYHQQAANESLEAAISSKCFTFYPGGETWALKRLAGISVDYISEGQSIAARSKNVNTFEMFRNFAVTQYGTVAAGEWIDVIRFRDWLVEEIKIRIVSALINADGKVPYTDEGIAIIVNAMRGALDLGVQRGGIAPEELDDENRVVPSYTISVPRSANISFNDKANRVLRDLKFTARLAGAIHVVEIKGSLSYSL